MHDMIVYLEILKESIDKIIIINVKLASWLDKGQYTKIYCISLQHQQLEINFFKKIF